MVVDLLRPRPGVNGVVVRSISTKGKEGEGRGETEESNIRNSSHLHRAESFLWFVCTGNVALGKEVSDLPALNFQPLIRIDKGRHSGLLFNRILVIIYIRFDQHRWLNVTSIVRLGDSSYDFKKERTISSEPASLASNTARHQRRETENNKAAGLHVGG